MRPLSTVLSAPPSAAAIVPAELLLGEQQAIDARREEARRALNKLTIALAHFAARDDVERAIAERTAEQGRTP